MLIHKKKILCFALSMEIFSIKLANSASLSVSQNYNFPGDVTYSGNTSGTGIRTTSSNAGSPWIIQAHGNITTNGNRHGIHADSGKLSIVGNGENTIISDNNIASGAYSTAGISIFNRGEINIENMNVSSSGAVSTGTNASTSSASGIFVENGSTFKMTGNSDGSNKFVANNNTAETLVSGLYVTDYNTAGSSATIENMDIEMSHNKSNAGIAYIVANYATDKISIKGESSGTNTFLIEDNFGKTQFAGIANSVDAKFYLTDMNINLNNNSSDAATLGLFNFGEMYITGVSSGINSLNINGNTSNTYVAAIENQDLLEIKNMNIDLGHNVGIGRALGINNIATMKIEGATSGTNTLSILENKSTNGNSYSISNTGDIEIKNMNIDLGSNTSTESSAVAIVNEKTLDITGVEAGTNYLKANNNSSKLDVLGIANNGDFMSVKNMSVEASNNISSTGSSTGISNDEGDLSILGVSSGINSLKINNNSGDSSTYGLYNLDNLTIQNMDIDVSNNISHSSFSTGIRNSGGIVDITGIASGANTLKISGNKGDLYSVGLYSSGNLTIRNMNIEANNNYSTNEAAHGMFLSGTSDFIGVEKKNNMQFYNNKRYAIATDGTVNIKNYNIYAQNNNFSYISGGGALNLENVNLNVLDSSTGFTLDGAATTAQLNVKKSSILTNNGTFAAFQTGTTSALIENSNITGAAKTAGGVSTLTINDSFWNIVSDSNVNHLNSKNSDIKIASQSSGVFNKLKVSSYSGDASTIYMNVSLNDDSSLSDQLIIDSGTATGNTLLDIKNQGGQGGTTQEGIKVVSAENGATIDSDAFALKGGKLDTGGYEYQLFQGNISGNDDQSMFLRSNGQLTDTAKTIANQPSIILNFAKAGMNSLMKRMGDLRNGSAYDTEGVWIRNYNKSLKVDDMILSKMNIYGLEGGYDHRVDVDNASGRFYIGGMIGYMYTDSLKTKQTNGARDGGGHASTSSVGAYATWLGNNGWFVDGVIRHFFEDANISSYASNGEKVKYDVRRQMTALSLEVGKQIKHPVPYGNIIIEPKVEMGYGFSRAVSATTNIGTRLKYDDLKTLSGKIALLLGYERYLCNAQIFEPYLHIGVLREFNGKTYITYADAGYESNLGGTSYEFGGGLNFKSSTNTALYSEFMYEKGSIIESLSTNLGFRYSW